jgi:hypothetical protein
MLALLAVSRVVCWLLISPFNIFVTVSGELVLLELSRLAIMMPSEAQVIFVAFFRRNFNKDTSPSSSDDHLSLRL